MDVVKFLEEIPAIINAASTGQWAFFALFVIVDTFIISIILKDGKNQKIKIPVLILFNTFILLGFVYISYFEYLNKKSEIKESATIKAKNIKVKNHSVFSAGDVNNSKENQDNKSGKIHADGDIEVSDHSTFTAGKVNKNDQ